MQALAPRHIRELHASGISTAVIERRGYRTVQAGEAQTLKSEQLSSAVWRDPSRAPGLLMPQWNVLGHRAPGVYKPDKPRLDERGKVRKYEAPAGQPSILDVHPINRPNLADTARPLWITEGIKKADCLTTHGECCIAIAGVWNWRTSRGPIGDWESIALKGRIVFICFDSDASTNPGVAAAMRRLGQFLSSRGAHVSFVLPPSRDGAKVGVDDYLADGGSVDRLREIATPRPPIANWNASMTDAQMAERFAQEVLIGEFRYAPELGWLRYDGQRWAGVHEDAIVEEARLYAIDVQREALSTGRVDESYLRSIGRLQSAQRVRALAQLARGVAGVVTSPADFDADPWLLNCSNGVLDLRSGELRGHDPEDLHRKCTFVAYRKGATDPDWTKALRALPDPDVERYVRCYLGTGATGKSNHDLAVVFVGQGANGKSTLLNGVTGALGDYGRLLPAALLGGGNDHATDSMELMGTRLAYLEETGPNYRLDSNRLKRLVGTPIIKARALYRAPVEFTATHSLLLTTNNPPIVTETDEGTWRRLLLVPFEERFVGDDADPGLRDRVASSRRAREAALAWLVEGAVKWHEKGELPPVPPLLQERTELWRQDGDLLFGFVRDRLEPCRRGFVETRDLLDLFNEQLPHGQHPWGLSVFATRIKDHPAMRQIGASWGHHSRTRRAGFKGVRVID